MRRAFSLLEVMVVMAVLPVILMVVSRMIMSFNRDIPRATQLVSEQTVVQQALDRIQGDVDEAMALPRSYGGWSSDDRTLLVEKADCVVLYRVGKGKVTRSILGPSGAAAEPAQEWMVPDASIRWSLWAPGSRADAVEVRSYLTYKLRSQDLQRLANTHLFFLVRTPKEVMP